MAMFRSNEEEVEYILHVIEDCVYKLRAENVTANRIEMTSNLMDKIRASSQGYVISRVKGTVALYGMPISVVATPPETYSAITPFLSRMWN